MSWEICPKCGFRTFKEGEGCFRCGFDDSYLKICPDCGEETPYQLKLCRKCGSDFKYKTCPNCSEKNENVTNYCSKCGFDFQKEEVFLNVIKNIDELKQLLDSNLISKDQFSSRILRMIKQKVVINLTLVEAKYFLGLIKSYEKESVIEKSTYDKISDYILEDCFYVPDSKKDNEKDIRGERQIKPNVSKPDPLRRKAEKKEVIPSDVQLPPLYGVRGWLLFLCISLTIIYPLFGIVDIMFAFELLHPLVVLIESSMIAASIYAGCSLWSIKPKAVKVAKGYLLVALVFGFISAAIQSSTNMTFGREMFEAAFKGLIYVLIWYPYLIYSKRVRATYPKSE